MTHPRDALLLAMATCVRNLCYQLWGHPNVPELNQAITDFLASLKAEGTAPAIEPLTIRAGHWYEDGYGINRGPMTWDHEKQAWKAGVTDLFYRGNGLRDTSCNQDMHRLIRECEPDKPDAGTVREEIVRVAIEKFRGWPGDQWSSMREALRTAAPLIAEDLRKEVERLRAENKDLQFKYDCQRDLTDILRSAPSEEDVRTVLRDVLTVYDRNTCTHEETHRGGVLWTICDSCGEEWADDEGGFKPYTDPPAIARARAILCEGQTNANGKDGEADRPANVQTRHDIAPPPASPVEAGGDAAERLRKAIEAWHSVMPGSSFYYRGKELCDAASAYLASPPAMPTWDELSADQRATVIAAWECDEKDPLDLYNAIRSAITGEG